MLIITPMMHPVFGNPRSTWQTTDPSADQKASHTELKSHERAEVVVIGAGITGLVAGLLLARSGKAVTLIDSARIPAGETSRSTAHLTEILDHRFKPLAARFGIESLLRFSEAHRLAIHRLGAMIEELDGPGACNWKRLPGYLYCENDYQLEALKEELTLLDQLHIPSAFIKHVPLPFSVVHAIRIENQAQVDPVALQKLLLRGFIAEGGRVFENSAATSVVPFRRGVRVVTHHGSISCDRCILATHSPILNPSVSHLEITPRQTYVVSAQLKNAPPMDGLFWDMESPYHYIRMANGEVLVGGEDHRTGQPREKSSDSIARLEDYARSRFMVETITGGWSGQVLETIDGLPLVGPSLRSDRILYATGYSGNGISLGALAGMLLSELALGRREDLISLLSPHRLNRRGEFSKFVSNNLVYPKNLIESRMLSPMAGKVGIEPEMDPATLAPGEARVGQYRGERIASYCDPEGKVKSVSARCTHLGGEVSFNDFQKTWDCACHGSRFDLDGNVLCGPAKAPLERPRVKKKAA